MPVKAKTKSLQKQVGINDGMINYEMEFEFAYDLINTCSIMRTVQVYIEGQRLDLFKDEIISVTSKQQDIQAI